MSETADRLLAALGHELRNPLAAAMTGLAVVGEMTEGGDPRAAFLERARRDLERLGRVLESYLSLGRGDGVRVEGFDLGVLLARVARRHDLAVVAPAAATSAPHTLPVHGDAALLERVVDNLIENARAVGATRVELRAFATAGEAVVDVVDDGPGVPPELAPRIFEPFVSGRGSSGIGLALARETLARHGGALVLAHNGADGACFRLTLPLAGAGAPARDDVPVAAGEGA